MKFDYKIIEEGEYSLKACLFLAQDMDVFDGHFDGFPILPAVAQLYMVEKIAQKHFEDLGGFMAMQQVKFMSPIPSGGTIDVSICLNPLKQLLTFEYMSENKTSSKGRLQYLHSDKNT